MVYSKRKGILFNLLAAFFLSTMAILLRLSGDIPVMEKSFYGNLSMMVVAWIMFFSSKEKIHFRKHDIPDMFARSFFGIIGFSFGVIALDNMNLSDATLLGKLSPFFAMLSSFVILKEKPSKRDWLFLIIAFSGALFVIKPGFNMKPLPAICGLISGFGAGVAYTYVRKLGQNGADKKAVIAFFATFCVVVCFPPMILNYVKISTSQIILLLCSGLCTTAGQFALTTAYTYAPSKEISAYDYSQVVFLAVIGYFLFNEIPDIYSVIGYVIIIGVSIINIRKN